MSELMVFPDRLKYRIFREPVRLNNDVKGLGRFVYDHLGKTGKGERIVFIFFNLKRDAVKLLYYDSRAIHVFKTALDKETFTLPGFEKDQRTVDIDPVSLMALLQGLKLFAAKSA